MCVMQGNHTEACAPFPGGGGGYVDSFQVDVSTRPPEMYPEKKGELWTIPLPAVPPSGQCHHRASGQVYPCQAEVSRHIAQRPVWGLLRLGEPGRGCVSWWRLARIESQGLYGDVSSCPCAGLF
jgi:hypothetical protein